jgi:hypothetical protein
MMSGAAYRSHGAQPLAAASSYVGFQPLLCGLACLLLAFAWQLFIVGSLDKSSWTALFNTGNQYAPPLSLQSEHITISDNSGYDAQFYHYVAHDPLLRQDLRHNFDNYPFRYSRILVPALAYLVALGIPDRIDTAYLAVVLAFVGLGGYCVSRYALAYGYPAATGLSFLFVPATLTSIETLVVDVALCALFAAWLTFREQGWRKAFLIMMLAPLVRETGAVLILAVAVGAILQRRWAGLATAIVASVPWLLWLVYVRLTAGPVEYAAHIPLSGTVDALNLAIVGIVRGSETRFVSALDLLATCGALLGIGLALGRTTHRTVPALAGALIAGIAIVQQAGGMWQNYHAMGRVVSPLILWLGMEGLANRRFALSVPAALMLPRFLFPVLARMLHAF